MRWVSLGVGERVEAFAFAAKTATAGADSYCTVLAVHEWTLATTTTTAMSCHYEKSKEAKVVVVVVLLGGGVPVFVSLCVRHNL